MHAVSHNKREVCVCVCVCVCRFDRVYPLLLVSSVGRAVSEAAQSMLEYMSDSVGKVWVSTHKHTDSTHTHVRTWLRSAPDCIDVHPEK